MASSTLTLDGSGFQFFDSQGHTVILRRKPMLQFERNADGRWDSSIRDFATDIETHVSSYRDPATTEDWVVVAIRPDVGMGRKTVRMPFADARAGAEEILAGSSIHNPVVGLAILYAIGDAEPWVGK